MIVIGAVILVLYTRWYWRTPSDCDFQYQYEINNPLPDPKAKPPPPRRWKCGHYRRAITLWILFSVWLSMAIILAMDLGTYMSIKNRMLSLGSAGTMLSLGSGGTQRIETTLGPGSSTLSPHCIEPLPSRIYSRLFNRVDLEHTDLFIAHPRSRRQML